MPSATKDPAPPGRSPASPWQSPAPPGRSSASPWQSPDFGAYGAVAARTEGGRRELNDPGFPVRMLRTGLIAEKPGQSTSSKPGFSRAGALRCARSRGRRSVACPVFRPRQTRTAKGKSGRPPAPGRRQTAGTIGPRQARAAVSLPNRNGRRAVSSGSFISQPPPCR